MITEIFKKACEACKSEEEFKAVLDAHKSELTEEELQQISGGLLDDSDSPGGSLWIESPQ